MKYALIDGRPCPAAMQPILAEIKAKTGVTYTSLLRNQAAVDFARRRGCTLSSQAELYEGYRQGRPGYNPANPPGQSTHELRSDGVAYNVPRRAPLRWWQMGIDSTNSGAVCRAARELGWTVTVTYPGNAREAHHVNFRKIPRPLIVQLKRGSKGRRVKKLTDRLSYLSRPKARHVPTARRGKPYLASPRSQFTKAVEQAVKEFQRDHHLEVDGVVGRQTNTQLIVSMRAEHARRKSEMQANPPAPKPKPPKKPRRSPRVRDFSDISNHQGSFDARTYGLHNDLVALKATEGRDYVDPTLKDRIRACRRAKLPFLLYHFARPQPGRTGRHEARHFFTTVRNAGGFKPGDLVPVLDLETASNRTPQQNGQFAREFRDELTKLLVDAGITKKSASRQIAYTGSFWRYSVAGGPFGYRLWLAAYIGSHRFEDAKRYVPAVWLRSLGLWVAWQYTDAGSTPGIAGPHDRNRFRGRQKRLRKLELVKARRK